MNWPTMMSALLSRPGARVTPVTPLTSMSRRDTMRAMTIHLRAGNVLTWNRAKTIQSKKKVSSKRACRKGAVRQELRRGE